MLLGIIKHLVERVQRQGEEARQMKNEIAARRRADEAPC
jgi:hypothetical protein